MEVKPIAIIWKNRADLGLELCEYAVCSIQPSFLSTSRIFYSPYDCPLVNVYYMSPRQIYTDPR